MAMGAQMTNSFAASAPKAGDSTEEKLLKIKSLLEKGLISQEDFDAKKKEILSNM